MHRGGAAGCLIAVLQDLLGCRGFLKCPRMFALFCVFLNETHRTRGRTRISQPMNLNLKIANKDLLYSTGNSIQILCNGLYGKII